MIVYYNPDCSKCNEVRDILEKNNCEIQFRNYLVDRPTEKELEELINKLACKPIDIVRKSEPLFVEKFNNKEMTDEQWITILSDNPILIERPIVIDGQKAMIGRPPVLVLEMIGKKFKNQH